ncbi:peptide deformylase [Prolixibacteraceae bacterium JC049]|jgi:peptide deformylase|nr:peptide deformylase [Prolixibacteraceae bacterium JC049]
MILPVTIYGDPVLRKVAKPIDAEYKGLAEFIENMWATMYHSDGVGLAAPQVGRSVRIFVVDATGLADEEPELADFKKVFINAEIIERFGDDEGMNEGCLSLPGLREDVTRKTEILIRYQDENFVEHEEEYSGFAARVIQHEYDHLEGKLFVDHLSPLRKRLLKGKLTNISKGKVNVGYKIRIPGK